MSLLALDGETCNEGEVVVYKASTVRFNCSYGNYPSATTYSWKLDNAALPFSSQSASIDIPAGLHSVECRAVIAESAECQCDESQTISVTVIGTRNTIIIRLHYATCPSLRSICLQVKK